MQSALLVVSATSICCHKISCGMAWYRTCGCAGRQTSRRQVVQRLRPRRCAMTPARHSPGGMLPPSPADKDNVVRARQQHGEYMRTLGRRRCINRGSSSAYVTSSSTEGRLHCSVPETAKPVDAPMSAPVRAQWRTHAQSSGLPSSYEATPTWNGVSTKGVKHAETCRSRRPAA